MNAINQIIESLNNVFAEMDARVEESSVAWGLERTKALREFKQSEEYEAIRKDAYKLYAKLHSIAGGKTWYDIFNTNSTTRIEEIMRTNAQKTAEKRNTSIANKLEKAGVSEVLSEVYNRTGDGFNGVFVVNTDKGKKRVTVETIYAGGYNIQCLHLRVLVKVK